MAWYSAPSLRALRREADALAPGRSKISDGTIGDAAHSARTSDHNPKPDGRGGQVVDAVDITHDPGAGMDIHTCLRDIAARGDERVKYLISDGEIWNPPSTAWATYRRLRAEGHSRLRAAAMALPGWRRYSGSNSHHKHGHVSVKATDAARNDTSPWFVPRTPQEAHVLVPDIVDTTLVPGATPDALGRFPFWAVKADGSVLAFNGAPFLGPHESLGTSAVIGIHARTDRPGYVLVTNDADQHSGAATYAFPTS